MNQTVLIVDDEQKYRELISLVLRSEGLQVVEADCGKQALQQFGEQNPDLILLDVMLPDMSGFDVCKDIRKTSQVPILFLSALEEEGYFVLGYRAGADDYIAKPFQPAVLALKVKRILQRTQEQTKNTLNQSGIVLDRSAYTCTVEGRPVELTHKEFELLLELMQNSGQVLTREYLLKKIWDYDYAGDTRTIDTQIKKLRKKLGSSAYLIKTVISVGYKMEVSQ